MRDYRAVLPDGWRIVEDPYAWAGWSNGPMEVRATADVETDGQQVEWRIVDGTGVVRHHAGRLSRWNPGLCRVCVSAMAEVEHVMADRLVVAEAHEDDPPNALPGHRRVGVRNLDLGGGHGL